MPEWLDGVKYLRIWKTKQKYQYSDVRKISTAQQFMVQRALNQHLGGDTQGLLQTGFNAAMLKDCDFLN